MWLGCSPDLQQWDSGEEREGGGREGEEREGGGREGGCTYHLCGESSQTGLKE